MRSEATKQVFLCFALHALLCVQSAQRDLDSMRCSGSLSLSWPPAVTELKWERPLRVVQYPDPRLRAQNARIATFGESLQQLAAEMFTVMYQ